mgnify:CR=1 FL=1
MATDVQEIEQNFPGYKETAREIGKQLSLRKKLLVRRIFLLIWPIMVLAVASVIVSESYKAGWLQKDGPYTAGLLVVGGAWFCFSFCYYAVLSLIFNIEKLIWVDSFFDKRNLEPKDSWRIARKLFWPYFRLGIETFVRYVLPAFILFFLSFFLIIKYLVGGTMADAAYIPVVAIVIVTGAIIIYFYLLQVILRYLPFVFLDRYGEQNFSYSGLFVEMRKLKTVAANKTQMRALLTHLTADVVTEISSTALGVMQAGLGNFGIVGKILGSSVRVVGEETTKQITSLGRIVAVYMVYQFVRQQMYGQAQHVNENLYRL